MKLALSGRIAEAPHEKTQALIDLPELAEAAAKHRLWGPRSPELPTRYRRLCVPRRRSPAGLGRERPGGLLPGGRFRHRRPLLARGLTSIWISLYESARQRIRPSIGSIEQIPLVREAADRAAAFGVDLVQFTHHGTPFNSVAGSLDMLRRVNRSNVGLVFEAANLYIEGQDYGTGGGAGRWPRTSSTPKCRTCSLLGEDEGISISAQGGYFQYQNLRVDDPRGVDIPGVVASLKAIGYDGWPCDAQPQLRRTGPAGLRRPGARTTCAG